jgi:3-oxoacyl-[acyl-carrier-protein] synthase-3
VISQVTAIREVACHWPPDRQPIEPHLRRHGVPASRTELYRRYFGFAEVPVATADDPATHLIRAARGLSGLAGKEHRVRYLVQARTLPVAAPYPVSAVQLVRQELRLAHATAFCVTQHACASALLAVELAGRLLAADGDRDALVLVLTGEQALGTGNRVIAGTAVLGECAAAVLVGLDGERDRVLSYATRTLGEFEDGASMSAERAEEFQAVYPDTLAAVMRGAVHRAGLRLDEVALVLPHNVNRLSWKRVLRLLGMADDRLFLDNLPTAGHCFGADPFLNYVTARQAGRLQRGQHYLMTAVGLGATFSALVVEH